MSQRQKSQLNIGDEVCLVLGESEQVGTIVSGLSYGRYCIDWKDGDGVRREFRIATAVQKK